MKRIIGNHIWDTEKATKLRAWRSGFGRHAIYQTAKGRFFRTYETWPSWLASWSIRSSLVPLLPSEACTYLLEQGMTTAQCVDLGISKEIYEEA